MKFLISRPAIFTMVLGTGLLGDCQALAGLLPVSKRSWRLEAIFGIPTASP
jgi:hypothetical protein